MDDDPESHSSDSVVVIFDGIPFETDNRKRPTITPTPSEGSQETRDRCHAVTWPLLWFVCLVMCAGIVHLFRWNAALQVEINEMYARMEAKCSSSSSSSSSSLQPSAQRLKIADQELQLRNSHRERRSDAKRHADKQHRDTGSDAGVQRHTDKTRHNRSRQKGNRRPKKHNKKLRREYGAVFQVELDTDAWSKNNKNVTLKNRFKDEGAADMVVLGPWSASTEGKVFKLHDTKNEIIITRPALYYIYSQVTFFSASSESRYEVVVQHVTGNSTVLARCVVSVDYVNSTDPLENARPKTCTSTTVRSLRADERLRVRIDGETNVSIEANANIFGLFRLRR